MNIRHEDWWAKEVEIVAGPFKGLHGVVQATSQGRIEIAISGPGTLSRLWFFPSEIRLSSRERGI